VQYKQLSVKLRKSIVEVIVPNRLVILLGKEALASFSAVTLASLYCFTMSLPHLFRQGLACSLVLSRDLLPGISVSIGRALSDKAKRTCFVSS
jgi:hypothetical protein